MSLRSDLSRTIKIAGVGVARLLDDGSVQIDYEDSSGETLNVEDHKSFTKRCFYDIIFSVRNKAPREGVEGRPEGG